MSSLNLHCWGGLGDTLAALPIAYALQEYGLDAILKYEKHNTVDTVNVPIQDLKPLPLYHEYPDVNVQDVYLTQRWNWMGAKPLIDENLNALGLEWKSTPRIASLSVPDLTTLTTRMQTPYVLICAAGRSGQDLKPLSADQLIAIRKECNAHNFLTVLIGDHDGNDYWVDVDLRGQTTVKDLCSLTYNAAAVVSTDTGVFHLAAAYHKMFLLLSPNELLPITVIQEYFPKIVLTADRSSNISPQNIRRALNTLLRVVQMPYSIGGPQRHPCGVAENGRIMAAALNKPYLPYKELTGKYNIIEYYEGDVELQHVQLDYSRTVISLHTVDCTNLSSWAGVLFKGVPNYKNAHHIPKRALYSPLPSVYIAPAAKKYSGRSLNVCWQGLIHVRKGVINLLTAWEYIQKMVPEATLTILGSTAHEDSDKDTINEIMAFADKTKYPSINIQLKDSFTTQERHTAFLNADAFCFPDLNNKEQSAAVANVLGYGVPILTSNCTAHNDTRAWCDTFSLFTLHETLLKLLTDAEVYDYYARRAWLGAQFRSTDLIARQYDALIRQVMLDSGDF